MPFWIALLLMFSLAFLFFGGIHFWYTRECKKYAIEKARLDLEKKKIFEDCILKSAKAIVADYQHRKVVFRPNEEE